MASLVDGDSVTGFDPSEMEPLPDDDVEGFHQEWLESQRGLNQQSNRRDQLVNPRGQAPAAGESGGDGGLGLSMRKLASGWSRYRRYDLEVDPKQDDKANEILICTFARPHMRAFHCAWWAFFVAFFIWFAISPLLPNIQEDLNLSNDDIWSSSIAGVGGTIFVRLLLGPLCDVYGARVLSAIVLCLAAIPTACTGLVQTGSGLIALRLAIGVAGGTFVMSQYWTSRMFTKEVVGTANALVGGWGNLGAGVTNILIGSVLFPLFEGITGSSETAWRTVCIVPAIVAFITGIVVWRISDDCPRGNYSDLKLRGLFPSKTTVTKSFHTAALNSNTWILFVQYACCFGVELTMNNAAALYFRDEFGLSSEAARSINAIFGWLNLFARGLGGFASDACMYKFGMKGRIWIQTILLLLEGCTIFVFMNTTTLGGAIATLVIFSLFVQAAEGTSYAIVPYVNPRFMGSVSGIVGAGGNVGAVGFGMAFRELPYDQAFLIMAGSIIGSSFLSFFLVIKGYTGILWGRDRFVDTETGKLLKKAPTLSNMKSSAKPRRQEKDESSSPFLTELRRPEETKTNEESSHDPSDRDSSPRRSRSGNLVSSPLTRPPSRGRSNPLSLSKSSLPQQSDRSSSRRSPPYFQ